MEYTQIPRELIYKERRSLEVFATEWEENTVFIGNMLENDYFNRPDAKEMALRCFNTAYYICTLILLNKTHPEWDFAKYCDIAFCGKKGDMVYQAFTLSLVNIFLTHTYYKVPCKKLLSLLDEFINSHYIVEYDPFTSDCPFSLIQSSLLQNTRTDLLIGEEFKPRKIDRDIYREVDGPNHPWHGITNYYERQEIEEILDKLGKDKEEKHILIDLINRDALRFYGIGNANYQERVKPLLDELNKSIDKKRNKTLLSEIETLRKENEKMPVPLFEVKGTTLCLNTVKRKDYDAIKKANDSGHPISVADLQARNAEPEAQLKEPTTSVMETDAVDTLRQQLETAHKKIEEQDKIIQEQEEVIADYSAKYDPADLRKERFRAMTAKQHVIFFLAILAYENRIPHNRKNMSWILSFISGRNESTTTNELGRKITQKDCDALADSFCKDIDHPESYECPFFAIIIRELPDKLKQDVSKKNRLRRLKK